MSINAKKKKKTYISESLKHLIECTEEERKTEETRTVEHKYYKLLKSHYKMVGERLHQMTRERNLSGCTFSFSHSHTLTHKPP